MDSSNNPDPVTETANEVESSLENSVDTENVSQEATTPKEEQSLAERITSMAQPAAAPATPVVPEKPAYTPNYKYKAFGKEKEIDEFFKPLVKDGDGEKKVKELFTRAEAFDDMKSKHEGTQAQFQELLSEHQALDKDVRKVMQFRQNGDFENFFQSLRISDEEIFEYARKKIEMLQMPPEQRQAFESQTRERQRIYDLEQQNQNWEQTYKTQADLARTMQLEQTMNFPDVQNAASVWDQKVGNPGAFRDLLIEEAQKQYFTTGQDLSPMEVAQMVMQKFGRFLTPEPQAQVSQETTQPAQPLPANTTQVVTKPVIPTTNGRGTSPIKKVPKSLDDLKAMSREYDRMGS